MNKKIILSIVTTMILCVTVWGFAETPKTFTDLKKDHWAYKSVSQMAEAGVIAGYPDGSFKPNNYVTYAEFIKMAVVSFEEKDPGVAKGKEHWGKNYFDKGLENGWYNENDISENALSHPIDRQHMALIASKIINKEENAVEDYSVILESISDVNIRNRYEFEIVTAYRAGVLSGYGDGTFRPEGTLTRAESASVIQRLTDESVRVLPDIAMLEKQKEEKKAWEEAEKDRPKTKLELIKENVKAVITFDPETDITPEGLMSVEKSIQYMDKLLDTIIFTGSNGEYYMSATFPELPKGFKWNFGASIITTLKARDEGRRGWEITTDEVINPEYMISAAGTIKQQIKRVGSLKDLQAVFVAIEIQNEAGDYLCVYGLSKGYDGQYLPLQHLKIALMDTKEESKYDYDIERHFAWQ